MSRTDRILISAITLCLAIMWLITAGHRKLDKKLLNALEIRLQNMEHLISLSLSEPRSPALTSPANRLPAPTNEIR